MFHLRNVLHPTDFSPTSQNALAVAAALARDYDARLFVLHVASPPMIVYGEGVVPPNPEERLETLHELLEDIRPLHGAVEVERRLVEGDDVPWEILKFAAEHQCDAIVMGTHGRGALGRLVMGSVAEEVLRKAPCPVITLKTPARAEVSSAALVVG
jgi:nucleotide-binding universal stress UspA family protein